MMDGTMLSERGMQHLKALTIEKDRVKRKRRLGPDMFNPLNPLDPHGSGKKKTAKFDFIYKELT